MLTLVRKKSVSHFSHQIRLFLGIGWIFFSSGSILSPYKEIFSYTFKLILDCLLEETGSWKNLFRAVVFVDFLALVRLGIIFLLDLEIIFIEQILSNILIYVHTFSVNIKLSRNTLIYGNHESVNKHYIRRILINRISITI